MNVRDDDLEQVLRPWMQRHAPDAPNELVLRIYGEIETMSEQAPSRSWLSRFSALPATAWMATLAALAVVAVVGGLIFGNFFGVPAGNHPAPTQCTSAAGASYATIADRLVAAWNGGDSQQVASLYASTTSVRLMIDSGGPSTVATSQADIATAMEQWHSDGDVLSCTGDVLAQGPYLAWTASWTSPRASFDGVEVIRVSSAGLVTEQYLFGFSPTSSTGVAAGSDVVKGLHDGMPDIAARLGATSGDLFALDAQLYEFQDGQGGPAAQGRNAIAGVLNGAPNPVPAHVGTVEIQGPLAVYAASNPITTGGTEEGFTVLELNSAGLIQNSWAIRSADSAPAASPSGG